MSFTTGVRIPTELEEFVSLRASAFGGNTSAYIRSLIESDRARNRSGSQGRDLIALKAKDLLSEANIGYKVKDTAPADLLVQSPRLAVFCFENYQPGEVVHKTIGDFFALKGREEDTQICIVLGDKSTESDVINWRALRTVPGLENLHVTEVENMAELVQILRKKE